MRGNLTKKENSTFAKILKEYQSGQNNQGGNLAEFDDKPELQESYILHIKKYWTNYLGLQSTPHLWESYHKNMGTTKILTPNSTKNTITKQLKFHTMRVTNKRTTT